MILQPVYLTKEAPGLPGEVASLHRQIADSLVVETVAGIPFGRGVSLAPANKGIVLGGALPFAVSIRDTTKAARDADLYIENTTAAALMVGDIWVTVNGAVSPAVPVKMIAASGKFGAIGNTLPGLQWLTSALHNQLALLRVGSFPQVEAVNPPINTVAPSISGTNAVGETLIINNGTWLGSPTLTRQWTRDGNPIAGATLTTYDLVAADSGHVVSALVTGTNAGGSTTVEVSNPYTVP